MRTHGTSIILLTLAACSAAPSEPAGETSLYALVQGIDGVYFYPPLGPEPTPQGAFDATLLDGLSVTIEAADADGAVTALGSFTSQTTPAVALLAAEERYWVNIPAAAYVTDPSKTYRVRVLLDGAELGASVLSGHVFEVLAWSPALPIGVHVRIEGSGAVRAIPRTRLHGSTGTPRHCSDGVRNKDETGVDCGGSCAPCCVPGGACSTGLPGVCAAGTIVCTSAGAVCEPNQQPTAEVCDGLDNDCDGAIDDGNPGGGAACSGTCAGGTATCTSGHVTCTAPQSTYTQMLYQSPWNRQYYADPNAACLTQGSPDAYAVPTTGCSPAHYYCGLHHVPGGSMGCLGGRTTTIECPVNYSAGGNGLCYCAM